MVNARIACDPSARIGRIHPFIYGHFIEHLRDCLYGGLWAEMLRNRKFAGHDQPRGGPLAAKGYGVIHPWVAVGRTPDVTYTHDNTTHYNGVQSQRVDALRDDGADHGIAQRGLTVRAGRAYEGRLVLSQRGLRGAVRVRLSVGDAACAEHVIADVSPGWNSYTYCLEPTVSSDKAEFSISFDGPGQLWIGAASLMPADHIEGWRRDVVECVKGIRPPILRYPGGNFVSGYRWRDGIGDRDRRPIRYDRAWNVWEPNDVGTDEFMTLCRLLDCEPYISVNAGDGTADEAAAWVEYCNGAGNSPHGALRAANGHAEPYGIVYWGIGNEMYGNWQIGHVDAETFARRHLRFAAAMRAVDPDMVLLGVGDMPDQPGRWLETVTRVAGAQVDLMTVHHYANIPEDADEATRDAVVTAAPEHIAHLLNEARRVIDKLGPTNHTMALSLDEWNVVHRGVGPRQNYALRDGLYAAGLFNALQHRCGSVTMANIAQLVNLLGVIETTPTGVYGTPIYYAFKLYREHCGDVALATEVSCEAFDAPAAGNMPAMEGIPYLSASASLDTARGLICLAVVNRHARDDIAVDLAIAGAAEGVRADVWVLSGPGMGARNSIGAPEAVSVRHQGRVAAGPAMRHVFGAHSATVIEIPLAR